MRLDHYLVKTFGFSRNKAQQYISDGLIAYRGNVTHKASMLVEDGADISLTEDKRILWVSRSAGKLEGFIGMLEEQGYNIRVNNALCLDIGSSTGGFTQILLDRGAKHVDAVDVGTDQLHAKLRDNKKVALHEKTDIRDFSGNPPYDVIVCDVSFISLRDILDSISRLSMKTTQIFLLFKPQFEVGRIHLRKTGVPKNDAIIEKALREFLEYVTSSGFDIMKVEKAQVIGEAGNQEYMIFIQPR